MSITAELVVKLIEQQLGSDNTLAQINEGITSNGVKIGEAIDVAMRVGNILQAQGAPEDKIIANIISSFKAAAYQKLQAVGIGFTSDPELHKRLNTFFAEVRQLIASKSQAPETALGGMRLGGLGGGGIPAGVSLTVDATPANKAAAPIEGIGINVLSSGLPGGNAPVTSSPLADIPHSPLPETAAPQSVVPVMNLNEPVVDPLEGSNLETYAEHELNTPKNRVSITAKEANDRITQYNETEDFTTPLADFLAGKVDGVYYAGADIAVRSHESKRNYLVGLSSTATDRLIEFMSKHSNGIATLQDALKIDGSEKKIISVVSQAVADMKLNVMKYHVETIKDESVTELNASEVTRFVNAYLASMSMQVHNAITLATNRCSEVPLIKGVQLERSMDDLNFFAEDLYNKTLGDNGFSNDSDFFRDLFLTVANSLGKLTVRNNDNVTVSLEYNQVEIIIPGNYASMTRNSVVGTHSLGGTAAAVTEIFEAVVAALPDVNVSLIAPQGKYLLLNTGEKTSPIRY